MKFAIITHVVHNQEDGKYYAYAPYVNEMNLWGKYVDEVLIVAPKTTKNDANINSAYQQKHLQFYTIPTFSFISIYQALKALAVLPIVFTKICYVCAKADHIHIRCPGNTGLLGCLAQMFFPKKTKTVKYAGNWDPNARQPWSYRFQKWLVKNTFLNRNLKVLVYGNWPTSSPNVKPFFTATYFDHEKKPLLKRDYSKRLEFVFVGTLSPGKQPLWCAKFIELLHQKGLEVILDLYGKGTEQKILEDYIKKGKLHEIIRLHGNQPKKLIKEHLQKAHFLLLPSKSEGWPKVIAEAMFWGCIPIVTPVSCVPWMLGEGKQGIIVSGNPSEEAEKFADLLKENSLGTWESMSQLGAAWSRNYTLDAFELAIKKLI